MGSTELEVRSTALVRPGDIVDAIDSKDLLDTLLAQNLDRIESKVDRRIRRKWLEDETKIIKARYLAQARSVYEKLWNRCGLSSVGHNYRLVEVNGTNTHQCSDCGAIKDIPNGEYRQDRGQKLVDSMREDISRALAEQMMELDIAANILVMPTEEMYPNIVAKGQPKKWWER